MTVLSELPDSQHRSAPAIIAADGETVSYSDLAEGASRVAGMISTLGVNPGEVVSLILPNAPRIVESYFGCFRSGAIAHPVNTHLSPIEVAAQLEHAETRLVLTSDSYLDLAEAAVKLLSTPPKVVCFGRRRPGAVGGPGFASLDAAPFASCEHPQDEHTTAALVYTSGSTSTPKGVLLSHANLAANASALQAALGLEARHRTLCFMPLYHCNALVFSHLTAMMAGASVVLCERFSSSRHWELVERHGVRSFSAPPTVLAMLLEKRDAQRTAPACVEWVKVGSAPLLSKLADDFEEAFGHDLILEGYGLTECTCTNSLNPVRGERRRGSVGKALPGHEIQILDEAGRSLAAGSVGEVAIKGPTVMKGYLKDPEATASAVRDGWMRTGDLGQLDEDGYLVIRGRTKEMIITGGENVSPLEVEDAIRTIPGVRDVGVVGMPDPIWGESVAAVVSATNGLTREAVLGELGERLAAYKVPRQLVFAEDLPRSAAGKLQRQKLAKFLEATKDAATKDTEVGR